MGVGGGEGVRMIGKVVKTDGAFRNPAGLVRNRAREAAHGGDAGAGMKSAEQ